MVRKWIPSDEVAVHQELDAAETNQYSVQITKGKAALFTNCKQQLRYVCHYNPFLLLLSLCHRQCLMLLMYMTSNMWLLIISSLWWEQVLVQCYGNSVTVHVYYNVFYLINFFLVSSATMQLLSSLLDF